jgi:hypothetical protein
MDLQIIILDPTEAWFRVHQGRFQDAKAIPKWGPQEDLPSSSPILVEIYCISRTRESTRLRPDDDIRYNDGSSQDCAILLRTRWICERLHDSRMVTASDARSSLILGLGSRVRS